MNETSHAGRCPVDELHTDSKSARLAAQHVVPLPHSRVVRSFDQARFLLRGGGLRQAGSAAAPTERNDPTKASIFFLEGEDHKRRRGAIARFFTPKAIASRHMKVMHDTADHLMAEFRREGRGQLDQLSLRMAVNVAAEILGLTNSDQEGMATRIDRANGAPMAGRGGIWKLIAPLKVAIYLPLFYFLDVRPAIAERKKRRGEDVISRLLDEGRTNMEILVECMTFGLAGMTTTREFIIMAAWHLFENDALRQRFVEGDDDDRHAILTEILRLEPVASMIERTVSDDRTELADQAIKTGEHISFVLRDANLDEAMVGPDPHRIDPDRMKKLKCNGAYMSFGDGDHFCPGWQVALIESRIFLEQLFRVPGVRMVRQPDMHFVPPMLYSYELRNAIIACDRS